MSNFEIHKTGPRSFELINTEDAEWVTIRRSDLDHLTESLRRAERERAYISARRQDTREDARSLREELAALRDRTTCLQLERNRAVAGANKRLRRLAVALCIAKCGEGSCKDFCRDEVDETLLVR